MSLRCKDQSVLRSSAALPRLLRSDRATHQRMYTDVSERMQQLAARWASDVSWNGWSQSYYDLCRDLQWLPLNQRR